MNPFSEGSWLWRAWRGRSVTFAALFALSLLGISALGELRVLLDRFDAPWYVWFLAPIVALATLAKMEQQWIPDPNTRRRWARGLVIGSIVLAIVIAKLTPDEKPPPDAHRPPRPPAMKR